MRPPNATTSRPSGAMPVVREHCPTSEMRPYCGSLLCGVSRRRNHDVAAGSACFGLRSRLLKQLWLLRLRSCTNVSDDGLGHVAALTTLRELHLGICSHATDTAIAHLASLVQLQHLDLSWCAARQLTPELLGLCRAFAAAAHRLRLVFKGHRLGVCKHCSSTDAAAVCKPRLLLEFHRQRNRSIDDADTAAPC
jgi:hypothetical protein